MKFKNKYVAVYEAMLANQKSYECGLEDLRTVCDGYFDKLKKDKPILRPVGDI